MTTPRGGAKPLLDAVLPIFVAACGDGPDARGRATFFAEQAAVMRGFVTISAPRRAAPGPQLDMLLRKGRAFRDALDALDLPAWLALGEGGLELQHAILRDVENLLLRASVGRQNRGGRPPRDAHLDGCYRNLVWAAAVAWRNGNEKPPTLSEGVSKNGGNLGSPFGQFLAAALEAVGVPPLTYKQARRHLPKLPPKKS